MNTLNLNYNGNEYVIIINRKRIKNTYIRVKDQDKICVTTSYLTTNKYVENLVIKNMNSVITMFSKNTDKDDYYLGKQYNIIYDSKDNIDDFNIYTLNSTTLDKLYLKQAEKIFKERLDYNYSLFTENIPYPSLCIRKMKTRWGVCNRKTNKVTLNFNLIHYDISLIDYVIIHELSHFVEFNHSKAFWGVVSKYCKNYKLCRKQLKE